LEIFKDQIIGLNRISNNVYTASGLRDYYNDLKIQAEEIAEEYEDEDVTDVYINDEFYSVLAKLQIYADEINDVMKDIYMFVTDVWRQKM
jgi:hypothetical protein